ncbi:type I restriction enzyme, S subunit [Sulfitobacter brevis]|uniref:Type I restriction enzyme, S subunit n=1 Tax=Sulfitobacter brevis TaxID=74348 RepID=A0A1I1UF77_9RHOB|nr:restriction endonuclease subunit S [Sulfitobacter brevis]SFD69502.1 type I restriction enzyme, S subunit [Sulfitobacter brevis]
MSFDRLLASFEKIGDDPDRIQQFRKIAIALAISGNLDTPSTTMPPEKILEALEKVKANLIKKGELPKQKKFDALTDEDFPESFSGVSRFARLGSLARIEKGQTGIQQAQPGTFPLVVTAAERGTCDHFDFDGAAAIVPLVSSTGHGNASLNRLHYQEGKFALGTILVAIFPHDPSLISARFIFEYLSAFKDELLVARMTGTANVTLSVGRVAEVPVPLVCPEVQAKVDELMALCDRLEEARTAREGVRYKLTAASLARLTAPENAQAQTGESKRTGNGSPSGPARLKDADFHSHARFALEFLPALTTRPDQIKPLRQTILNLAVRGKLVEQDACDEAPSLALSRIAAERDELVRNKIIRREKPLAGVDPTELPFEIPKGWNWARVGDLSLFTQYGTSEKSHPVDKGVPVLAMGNIQDGRVIWGNDKKIPATSKELPNLFLKTFDLLYNRTNSAELVGKTGLYLGEDDCRTFASYLIRIRLSSQSTSPYYLNLAMNAPVFRDTQIVPLIKKQTGQANVNGTALKNMLVPLPPLAEQHRIVAKVDALMALCDRLEASLATADTTRQRLLTALLHEALEPAAELEIA